jgi:UDP-N-acetyl-D-glucosamine dehydrogenase
MSQTLIKKIADRSARIGVIGLGYVGLPLVIEFFKSGFGVTGFDVDKKKVEALRKGEGYIQHVDISPIVTRQSGNGKAKRAAKQPGTGKGSFVPTNDFSRLRDMDCVIICVPTPLTKYREPDLSYVMNTTRTIARHLRKGQLVVLESTTYPGTTDQDMRTLLEETGLKAGKDFFLAFSPEREDPNNKDYRTGTIPKVVGGYTKKCLKAAVALYDTIVVKTVPVSSTRVAEATKLIENIYRSVNIALVNELKVVFDKMGIDIWEAIDAAKTKPFGFQAFYPGPGLGGHCIPIDPFYLTWKAREYGLSTRFIELAGEINTSMPDYVISKVVLALNDVGKHVKGARILILGLSYKANVDDDRESPTYRLMEKLEEMGAKVSYNDPHIPEIKPSREFSKFAGRKSKDIATSYDLFLVATAHNEYLDIDPESIGVPIVDTRNLIKNNSKLVYRA